MKTIMNLVMVAVCVGGTACSQAEPKPQPASAPAPVAVDVKGGFQPAEAQDMIDLCIDLNEPTGASGVPGWELKFDGSHDPDAAGKKGVGPYENAWRLWKKQGEEKTYAIAIRGTIESLPSIEEDLLATSLDANQVQINLGHDKTLRFTLAKTGAAEVHLGFSYGVAVLMFHKRVGILKALKEQVPPGSKVYITGHSQGAAMATLAHSFLYYAQGDSRYGLPAYGLKSYVFAQPKPGNWQYGMDFAKIAGNRGLAYVVNNVLDWVPQVPITIEFIDEPSKDIADEYKEKLNNVALKAALDGALIALKGLRGKVASAVKQRVEQKIQGYGANLDYLQPGQGSHEAAASSINYVNAGNLLAVSGADDSSIVSDGVFTQHHASNYKKLLKTLGPAQ